MAETYHQNFDLALKKLVAFCKVFNGSEIERAGVIQAFEFTFEQAWKAIQKKAGDEGVTVGSPKKAFAWAMSVGWIQVKDEPLWISMLNDRNLTTHAYRETMADEISQRILQIYVKPLQLLLGAMKGSA